MIHRSATYFALLVLAAAPLLGTARAQTSDNPDAEANEVNEAKRTVDELWDTSSILKMAVNNLAIRYNLNEEQRAYTDDMMTTRVSRFIEKRQAEIWPLLRDLILQQRNGTNPDPDVARRLGPPALKIIREAKEEIFASNEEWREILTDQQKKMHDWDLREMKHTFRAMERNFESWARGDAESSRIFPAVSRRGQPRVPSKPTKSGTLHLPRKDDPELDDQFEIYVSKFISDFALRPDQKETAKSILREIKHRAADFRKVNAARINEVKTKLTQARTVGERRKWNEKRRVVLRPIGDLFGELKQRLDQIPDEAQRERFQLKAAGDGSRAGSISSTKGKRTTTPKRQRPPTKTTDE